jgi:hypothetical protein
VCTVSEGLLERTLNVVLGELVGEAVKCFSQVKEFGTGGLLTVRGFFFFGSEIANMHKAVMELTFIQKSLGYYGRETAALAGKILARCARNRLQMRIRHRQWTQTSTPHFKACRRHCPTRHCCTISMFQTNQLEIW